MSQMYSDWQIVGLFLIRDEEYSIEWAIKNVLDFCDRIIVCDNGSSDQTRRIVSTLVREYSKIELRSVENPRESHEYIEDFVGSKTWVFAVDGDEIYDPAGLSLLRGELLSGKHASYFKLTGHSLHTVHWDANTAVASGYFGPPSKTVNKLYNFSVLECWRNPPFERLHGGEIVFKSESAEAKRMHLSEKYLWDVAPLRCLHLCFMKRSSLQKKSNEGYVRKNISDLSNRKPWHARFWKYVTFAVSLRLYRPSAGSGWKLENYCLGKIQQVSISPFLDPARLSNEGSQMIRKIV